MELNTISRVTSDQFSTAWTVMQIWKAVHTKISHPHPLPQYVFIVVFFIGIDVKTFVVTYFLIIGKGTPNLLS